MIDILRNIDGIEQVVCRVAHDNATVVGEIMAREEVNIDVVVDAPLALAVGDYVRVDDTVYTLNRETSFDKKSAVEYRYNLLFESPLYRLLDKLFVHPITGLSTFTISRTLAEWVKLVVDCANEIDPGWTVAANIFPTEPKSLNFESTSCREALNRFVNEFGVEFFLSGKEIYFVERIENETDLVFEQGKGKGLYTIGQEPVDDENTITRVFPYGGTQNVTPGEGDALGRLYLPEKCLENFSEYSKVVEKEVIFDKIFPKFTGSAETVSGDFNRMIICSAIDFDIAAQAIGGTPVKINILTGDLMGESFEFGWKNETKEITLIRKEDETALPGQDGKKPLIPSESRKVKAGDSFNFTDLNMPASYKDNAVIQLRKKATEWLVYYSRSRVKFTLEVDHRYLRGKHVLKAGDLVTIKIPETRINKLLRITSIERNLKTGKMSCTVSNYLDEKWEKKIEGAISDLKSTVGGGNTVGGGSVFEIIKTHDLTLPTDYNVYSAARTDEEIKDSIAVLDDRFILKHQNDVGYGFYTWEAGFMTKSTIRSAECNIGWEVENPIGWSVSETGTAWYTSLNVRGPILSNNIIGSPYYASGWTGFGSQWDLSKHRLETDFVSVRKELRVYALDVFRIYGTNGDLAVSTTNKIDRVEDMDTVWRCHIDDYDGEMYMNMRIDDIVKCQTWEKKSGRYYMARVTDINNTWFELSKTLLEGETTPAKGDVLIRWDNLTNADRKGLLYLSASDNYAPYMDVRYGDWNATFGTIKVRNGRLDGINDPAFPELYGAQNNFGLYTCNFYGTGELILRSTGESVSRTFEVLKDSIKMGLDEVRYEIQVSQDSILSNPIFKDDTTGWEITNVIYPWTINGGLLAASGNPFVNFISGAVRVIDPVNDRTVLQVTDSTVTQRNAIFTDRKPGKYALRFAYRSLLGFGKLEVGVSGSNLRISVPLSENQEYQKAEIISEWDGTGDFIIKVTGGTVNITDISFTSDKLANAINEIKVYYDTKLTFYAEKAVMNSFREEYDKFNQVVKKDYATQTWTYNAINTEVGTIVNGKLTNYSTTSQTSTMINNKVADLNMWQYATTTWTSQQIENSVVDLTGYATQKWTSGQITSSVSNKANTSYVDQMADALSIRIQGAESITDAFYKFDSTRMMTNRRIEIGSGGGTGFVASAGFAPSSIGPAFWCGSTFANRENASIKLSHDGSGWLAKKNINWDTGGNATFTGKLVSRSSGNRIIIDPATAQINGYDSAGNASLRIGFDASIGSSVAVSKYSGGMWTTRSVMTANGMGIQGVGTLFYVIGGNVQFKDLPTSPSGLARGYLYREGNTVKIV